MIIQNGKEDNVIKTTALEEDDVIKTATFEDVIEFNTKENAVDYAYVTIATVYMPGQTWCHVQEDAAKLGGGERAQIGQSAVARREETPWKLGSLCREVVVIVVPGLTFRQPKPNVQWGCEEGPGGEVMLCLQSCRIQYKCGPLKQSARGPTPPLPLLRPGSVLTLVTKVSGRVTRQYLHRGSCLYLVINVIILPVYEPKLSPLGVGSHRGQGNR